MKCNLAKWDIFIRYIISIFMLSFAIAGGPSWMYSGLYLLVSASWGYCAIYSILGIKTLSESKYPYLNK